MMAPKDGATEWAGNFGSLKRCEGRWVIEWYWMMVRVFQETCIGFSIFIPIPRWKMHYFVWTKCSCPQADLDDWSHGCKCWMSCREMWGSPQHRMRDSYDDYLPNVFWIAPVPRFGRWQDVARGDTRIQCNPVIAAPNVVVMIFSMRWSQRRCSQRSSGKSWRTWHGCTGGAMAWLDEQRLLCIVANSATIRFLDHGVEVSKIVKLFPN